MAFRQRIRWTRVALGFALSISALWAAGAQAQHETAPDYTPEPAAKDLRAVLFNWGWYTGMLRSRERDLIGTLEYQGSGTIQVDGQPCRLTKYRVSTNYLQTGQRVQYTCIRPNGQSYANIEDVSGEYAWDEDIPGAELIPGKGKATPMPNAVRERLIRLWAGPQGALKSAMAGIKDPPLLGQNPGIYVPTDVMSAGKTSVSWVDGKPVVAFPIPGVPGAMATATLNAKYMADKVVVKDGSNTTEFTYSNYQDWNNPLNKVEALYAGKITETCNGKVIRDLTTIQTETGQVYVVVPVPESVRAAITPTATAPNWVQENTAPPPDNKPTPRLANGHPDLSGVWMPVASPNGSYGRRRCGPTQVGCIRAATNFTTDYEFYSPSRYGPAHPIYKPEFWDKIQELDEWTNKDDPVMTCQPLGIPREGPPRRIYETDKDVTFLYAGGVDAGGGNGEYRIIPTDGRPHDPQKAIESTYMGYTVGHWEGDTLVLDAISFVDSTWLGRGGYFHSDAMHVVEKLTRKGNEMTYQLIVEDPDDFVQPFVKEPETLVLSKNPDAGLMPERSFCEMYEQGHISEQIRH